MKEFFRDLSTALREDGQGSPFSSKRIAAMILVISAIVAGFMVLCFVTKIAVTGSAFGLWITGALLGVPVLFLVFSAIFFYFATKKDLDDTMKVAAEIVKTSKLGSS